MTEPENQETLCKGCGNVIEPELCWCGNLIKTHNPMNDGHYGVPAGCDCHRCDRKDKAIWKEGRHE